MQKLINDIAAYGVFEALPVSVIAAAIYLCARIVYLKAKKLPRKSFGTELSRCLLVGYIAALIIIVWLPLGTLRGLLDGSAAFEELRLSGYYTNNQMIWRLLHGDFFILEDFEIIANIVLFIPFGFLLPMSFRRLKWWAVDLIGLGATCLVELVQPYLGRTCDLDDIITNAIGAVIGCIIAKIIISIRRLTRQSAERP